MPFSFVLFSSLPRPRSVLLHQGMSSLGPKNWGHQPSMRMVSACAKTCYHNKEHHFFDYLDAPLTSEESRMVCSKWKKNHGKDCLPFDITPANTILPSAADFFFSRQPKMVLLFRDPIDRLLSKINMVMCIPFFEPTLEPTRRFTPSEAMPVLLQGCITLRVVDKEYIRLHTKALPLDS